MASAGATHDRLTARLGDMDAVRTLLVAASDRLDGGWTQGRWRSVEGVCLVAALRLSGRGRVASRAVDVTWHALWDDPSGVRWLPAPPVRQARVRELTGWNDARGRTLPDVLALLGRADEVAAYEMGRLRADLGTSVDPVLR
jgi:hypothetical protein